MFLNIPQERAETIFDSLKRIFNYSKSTKILPIDFTKPWYLLLFKQSNLLVGMLGVESIGWAIMGVFPLLLGYLLNQDSLQLFIYFMVFVILYRVFMFFALHIMPAYSVNIDKSLTVNAYSSLITIDPEFHATRSSGQIISKITRASTAYKSVVDIINFTIGPTLVSFLAISISLFTLSSVLSIVCSSLILVLLSYNIIGFRFRSKVLKQFRIKSEDAASAINIESMVQNSYIRSTFSTDSQINEIENKNKITSEILMVSWRYNHLIVYPTQIILYVYLLLSTVYLYSLGFSMPMLLGYILTLQQFTNKIHDLGKNIDVFLNNIDDIDDLFDFINNFGKQTFPVLTTDMDTKKPNPNHSYETTIT